MINVKFRVTGMYVGSTPRDSREISVSVKENPKVVDIMRAVSRDATAGKLGKLKTFMFTPSNPRNKDSITAIYAVFEGNINDKRKAGLYGLVDDSTSNPIKTFQYYIYDENFKQLNNNGRSKRFVEYPDLEANIRDGYTVVIRQVSILTGPIAQGFPQSSPI